MWSRRLRDVITWFGDVRGQEHRELMVTTLQEFLMPLQGRAGLTQTCSYVPETLKAQRISAHSVQGRIRIQSAHGFFCYPSPTSSFAAVSMYELYLKYLFICCSGVTLLVYWREILAAFSHQCFLSQRRSVRETKPLESSFRRMEY